MNPKHLVRIVTCVFTCLVGIVDLGRAQDVDPEDRNAKILLALSEKGEGAPSREALDTVLVLTSAKNGDPWWPVVEACREGGSREVVPLDPDHLEKVLPLLREKKTGFIVAVFPPTVLNVNFHFAFLELLSQLDSDPFVDTRLGYVTGATPEEALHFVKGWKLARRAGIDKSILEFGPSSKPSAFSAPMNHPWADGFTTRTWMHAENAPDIAKTLADRGNTGILSASGHGMPAGVDHGLKGLDIRASKLDLTSTLYFSGPCYCGVAGKWFSPAGGVIQEKNVDPKESFLLALIGSRITAAFAGLDPDRGETNQHELEHLLLTGSTLGSASKSTYDDAVLAYRRNLLKLPRYEPGEPDPHRDIADTMIAGGACRALFGDPTWAPIPKSGKSPFEVRVQHTTKGLTVRWLHEEPIGSFWTPVDIYRAEGGWTHRLRFTESIPIEKARALRRWTQAKVMKDGQPLPFVYPTAALELFGGKAFLHLLIVFPRSDSGQALWNGKRFEAEIELSKS